MLINGIDYDNDIVDELIDDVTADLYTLLEGKSRVEEECDAYKITLYSMGNSMFRVDIKLKFE